MIVPATPEPTTEGGGAVFLVVLVEAGAGAEVIVDEGAGPGVVRIEEVVRTPPIPATVPDPPVTPITVGELVLESASDVGPEPDDVEVVVPPPCPAPTDTPRPELPHPTSAASRAAPTNLAVPLISDRTGASLSSSGFEAHGMGETTKTLERLGRTGPG
ncbi:MAG: hypothetical protein ACYDAD_00385 [Acidimicrobiales bacterium]